MKKLERSAPGAWPAAACVALLLLLAGGLLDPGAWLWFLSGLTHVPVTWSLTGLTLAGVLLWAWWHRSGSSSLPISPLAFDAFVLVVATGLFVGVVTQTHFLGDGYQLLANLAKDHPLVRPRERAVMWILGLLKKGWGADASSVLKAYRTLAIAAGVLSVTVTLWLSHRLISEEQDRRLFCGFFLTGGSTLLFFGYVEHYALWHVVLNLFGLTGVLAFRNSASRWVAVALLALSLLLHPVSLFLAPVVLYLLLPTGVRSRVERAPRSRPLWALAILVACLYVWTQTLSGEWYQLRFAFLPLSSDVFTVDGYTLFSPAHVLDFANLLLELAPGVLVAGFIARSPLTRERGDWLALQLYLLSALLLGFLLDPKLGLPRDWDLFAFVGTPLLLWSWFYVIQPRLKLRVVRRFVALAIVFQALVLGGRVATLARSESAIKQALAYFDHAPGRSRTGWSLLGLYYLEHGDSTSFRASLRQREERYPEERVALQSQRLNEQGHAVEAGTAAREALRINPRTHEAWVNLGRYFRHMKQYDSSLICMQIADGLNPYLLVTLVELGMAKLTIGDADAAERIWLNSLTLDSSHFITYGALANLCASRGDTASQVAYLRSGLNKADAESWAIITLADLYVASSRPDQVQQLLTTAQERGFDSTTVAQLRERLVTGRSPGP